MTEAYFAYGTTLAGMVNVETVATGFPAPHVIPVGGGKPMPLQGGVARRALSSKLRRSGYAAGAWAFNALYQAELNALLLALYGDYTTSSSELYISTLDTTGHYSPFLCHVDCAYVGDSYNTSGGGVPIDVRFDLVGGVLQSATKTSNFTVTTSTHHLYADTSGGSITFALPAIAGVPQNVPYSFIKTSASNSMVLDPNGAETIDGASTKTTTANNARVDIVNNGTQWVTI